MSGADPGEEGPDAGAFRPGAANWIDDPDQARHRLAEDALTVVGHIADASNHAVLCRLGPPADGHYAVYKPAAGVRPLWDFDVETLHRREVAAHVVSELLGWGLVPPTVVREGPHGIGSVQLFVPHDPAEHYFELVDARRWHPPLAQLAMFDLTVNNADRKGGHILRHLGLDRLYGIDNGLTFHPEPKLRTVIWDVGHVPFLPAWKADLLRLAEQVEGGVEDLANLLGHGELQALVQRARWVAALDAVPPLPPDARPYPWPMV